MKRQTGLQDYRVARGAAVGSDVLQAKNALASATTGRVAAQGALEASKIGFKSKFGMIPENIDLLLPIQVPRSLSPATLADFENALFKDGDAMKGAQIAYDKAVIARDKSFASSFLPEFNLTAEVNAKDHASGTRGGKTEYIGKIEMTWPIELFGTQLNSYRSSEYKFEGATLALAKAQRDIENSISNSWIAFQTASASRSNII